MKKNKDKDFIMGVCDYCSCHYYKWDEKSKQLVGDCAFRHFVQGDELSIKCPKESEQVKRRIDNLIDNYKAKADKGKLRISLVPTQIIKDIAQVRMYGNDKYGDSDSWKTVEVDRYVDALLRHTLEFIKDKRSKDNESGIEHYKHMACNMAFICEMLAVKESV